MKLVAVKLRNFRCYREEIEIELNDLTAIVGKNDMGKSAILEALDIFFGEEVVKISKGDACVSGDATDVRISCIFSDLPDTLVLDAQASTNLRAERLTNAAGNFEAIKVWDLTKAKPSAAVFARAIYPQAERFVGLHQKKQADLRKLVQELQLTEACQQNSNPSMRHAIFATATQETPLAETDVSLEGTSKDIWEALAKRLPIFGLFQADRSSTVEDDEVQNPMKLAVKRAVAEAQPEIDALRTKVEAKALDIAQRTLGKLREAHPDVATGLAPRLGKEPTWTGFSIDLDDERGVPINKRGSGVRRLILMSFFRAEVERKREEAQAAGQGERGMIFAIEEPETSQHPSNQLLVVKTLSEIACGRDQVILTTHQPALAAVLPRESLRFLERTDDGDGRQVLAGTDAALEAIAESLGVLPSPINKPIDQLRVVLVFEGPNDEAALLWFSRILNLAGRVSTDLTEPCPNVMKIIGGGSGTLQYWVEERHIDKLGLPQVHIYDSDKEHASHPGDTVAVQRATDLNRLPNRHAFVTRKRNMDNYLAPEVVSRLTNNAVDLTTCGFDLDYAQMSEAVYTHLIVKVHDGSLPTQLRGVDRAGNPISATKRKSKEWVCDFLMGNMTEAEILARSAYTAADGTTQHEVLDWLQAIDEFARPIE